MNVLGLFSGIGGFELGFQRAGFAIAGMCEIEPYARAVLAVRFPGVLVFRDIRNVTARSLELAGIVPDVVTGGFPCQDISLAGKGAGLSGERSGLWWEMHRVIAEVRPRWVVAENVAALRSRGLDKVLGSLAQIGYDAEWHCIPASAVGAPHRRDRIWIVAHPNSDARYQGRPGDATQKQGRRDADRGAIRQDDMANAHQPRLEIRLEGPAVQQPAVERGGWWLSEPDVGRVVNGISSHMDCIAGVPIEPTSEWARKAQATGKRRAAGRVYRLRALGNAVVPQIPEAIARAILNYEGERNADE